MSYLGESTMDRRRFLWDWIDEHYPYAFAGRGYPILKSASLRDEAIRAVSEHFGITRRHSALGRDVRHWLDDPDRFSPHVDEIALELAMGFDWDAIAALTQTEYGMLVDRLDARRDPFDRDTEDKTTDGYGGASVLVAASKRRWAYLRGPSRRRYQLADVLARKRVRAAEMAA